LSAYDYSLLLGNVGLFIILAIVMFFSRKIDWEKSPAEE
jgi:inner membrane protein involved in colicin E2 resistance